MWTEDGGRHGNVATDGEGERDGGVGDLAWRPAAMNTATKSVKACSGEASDVTSGVSIPPGRTTKVKKHAMSGP